MHERQSNLTGGHYVISPTWIGRWCRQILQCDCLSCTTEHFAFAVLKRSLHGDLIDSLSGSLMLEEGMDSKDGKDGEYGNVDGPQGGRFALSRSPDWTVPP